MVMYDDTDLDLPFGDSDVDDDSSGAAKDDTRTPASATPLVAPPAERPVRSLPLLASVCVLGGVTLAPLLAILGCIGLAMPTGNALHQAASLLVCAALLWLGVALITAQGTRREASASMAPDSGRHV